MLPFYCTVQIELGCAGRGPRFDGNPKGLRYIRRNTNVGWLILDDKHLPHMRPRSGLVYSLWAQQHKLWILHENLQDFAYSTEAPQLVCGEANLSR